MNVWFTSDTHFRDRAAARHRGFRDADEHDEHLIAAWNDHVAPIDTVWLLGDAAEGAPEHFGAHVARLNGTIHLVLGNHDKAHPMYRDAYTRQRAWLEHFASLQTFARRKSRSVDVMLSHFPYAGEGKRQQPDRYTPYRLRNEGMPLLHGHTHDTDQRLSHDQATPMIHVGWDAWKRPVHSDEIATILSGASV